MQSFKVKFLKSVGELNFEMSRTDVRKLLGNYKYFDNIPDHDEFELCSTFYDQEDKLIWICFYHLDKVDLILDNENLSKMTITELDKYISNYSKDVEINNAKNRLDCDELGFSATFGKSTISEFNHITNEIKIHYGDEKIKENTVRTLCFMIKNLKQWDDALVYHTFLSDKNLYLDSNVDINELQSLNGKKIKSGYRIVYFYEDYYKIGSYAIEHKYFMEDFIEGDFDKIDLFISDFISNEDLLQRYLENKPEIIAVAIYNIDGNLVLKKERNI